MHGRTWLKLYVHYMDTSYSEQTRTSRIKKNGGGEFGDGPLFSVGFRLL